MTGMCAQLQAIEEAQIISTTPIMPGLTRRVPFICECANDDCLAPIKLTLQEYEQLRQNPRCFAVLPGHEIPDIEEVVERHERYLVVEKHVETHDQVESADPRS